MFALSDVHLSHYHFCCRRGDELPSGEEQFFSQFGDRHLSVFMQSKVQFCYVFRRRAPGTMRCYKLCLIFGDDETGEGNVQGRGRAVWVVEVKPVTAIMSINTIIVINIAL